MSAKIDLQIQARLLYIQGSSVEQIAQALGRSETSVYRWKEGDRRAGNDWEARRKEKRRRDPEALLAILETRQQEIAKDTAMETARQADTLWKLQRVIDSVREESGDIGQQLIVIDAVATWAHEHIRDDDQMAILREVFERYMDDLRRRCR